METLKFQNGSEMPLFGLGTWKSKPGEVYSAVKEALRLGYKHIDCAAIYGNEVEIGKAFRESFTEGIVTREELWITSKLWNNAHAKEDVLPALKKTLSDLSLDYLDLYLIHWPIAQKKEVVEYKKGEDFLSLEERPLEETWSAMELCVAQGLSKNIGVSNFSTKKLKQLLATAKLPPEMNQIELHPYLQQDALLNFCKNNSIHVTAYSPLGSADRSERLKAKDEPILLEDPLLLEVAAELEATPAQVLIRWAMQRHTAVIPKSVNPERLNQNLEATKLSLPQEAIEKINTLDKHRRYVDGTFWELPGSPYNVGNVWDEAG